MLSDLISRKALLDDVAYFRLGLMGVRREAVERFVEYVEKAPAIDAEPVRYASLKETGFDEACV